MTGVFEGIGSSLGGVIGGGSSGIVQGLPGGISGAIDGGTKGAIGGAAAGAGVGAVGGLGVGDVITVPAGTATGATVGALGGSAVGAGLGFAPGFSKGYGEGYGPGAAVGGGYGAGLDNTWLGKKINAMVHGDDKAKEKSDGDQGKTCDKCEADKKAAPDRTRWSKGKPKDAEKNAQGHWDKHGSEFPEYGSSDDYIGGAHDFVDNPPDGTLTKPGSNGGTLMYDPKTNTFASVDANGNPKTMFRPTDGMNYWNRQ